MAPAELRDTLWARVVAKYEDKEKLVPRDILTRVERDIMLQIVDQQWKDHLYSLDHLKEGIGLRGYGQRDPLVEYKKESFALFQDMRDRIEEEIVRYLWLLKPVVEREGGEARVNVPAPRPAPRSRRRSTTTTRRSSSRSRSSARRSPPRPGASTIWSRSASPRASAATT